MFKGLKGNARGCLMYEPMFLLPYSLYITYASVYMLELGVTEKQIGLLTSIGLVLQMVTSFLSGYLTDRLGRKRALLIFDFISWTVGTLLWAVAQNFWFFLAAAVVNSFQKVPNTAWYCLLVEGTEPKERTRVFTVLQFIQIVSGLLAPLGGLLVSHLTVVPAVRIMYAMACLSMSMMFIFRNFATEETEIGRRKREEHKAIRIRSVLTEYAGMMKRLFGNRALLLIFGIYILYQFQLTMSSTYLSIYLVKALKFSDSFIAWFPALTSAATLFFMLFIVPRLKEDRVFTAMITGLITCTAATVLLILTPPGSVAIVCISTVLSAAGSMLVYPNLESTVQNSIEDEYRAGTFSMLSMIVLLFISPAGIVGGWTFSLDPRLPFVLIIAAFGVSIALLVTLIASGKRNQPTTAAASAK